MLQNSLGPNLAINKTFPKNLQVIIDKNIVEDYVKRGIYLCLVAKINFEIAGWIAGSSKSEILSEHGCSSVEFYIEEIVIDSHYRRRGIGSFLLSGIPKDHFNAIVLGTPLINKQAIAFYEKSGFLKVLGLPGEFYKTWTRMSKPV